MRIGVYKHKYYFISILLFLAISYSCYLIFDIETIAMLGEEDGFFEYFTALSFLVASILFLRTFFLRKNFWFLILSIVFLLGFGEEISWGQRIWEFTTPELISDENVQKEFSIHNLELFNARNLDGTYKTGFSKLLCINFLFLLFSISYGFVIPLFSKIIKPIEKLIISVKLPLVPIGLGIFFVINWLTLHLILNIFLPPNGFPLQYYDTCSEIYECTAAFIFFIISIYLFRNENNITKQKSA